MKYLIIDFLLTEEQQNHFGNELLLTGQDNAKRTDSAEIGVAIEGRSPLTDQEFTVKALFEPSSGKKPRVLRGYRVGCSPGRCTTGQDAVTFNDGYHACKIAEQLLTSKLESAGMKPEHSEAFSLNNAEIQQATLTFHSEHLNLEEVHATKRALFDHAEALHNDALPLEPERKDRVRWYGGSRNGVWKLKNDGVMLRVSQPDFLGVHDQSNHQVLEKNICHQLQHEAQRYLTFDVTVDKSWLNKNNAKTPKQWNSDRSNPEAKFVATIRRLFWADFPFRHRALYRSQRPSVKSVDSQLLQSYFNHDDVTKHPSVTQDEDPKAFFDRANKRARAEYNIDYSIPWVSVKECLCRNISDILTFIDHCQVSTTLKEPSFGPETSSSLCHKLKCNLDDIKREAKAALDSKAGATTTLPTPGPWWPANKPVTSPVQANPEQKPKKGRRPARAAGKTSRKRKQKSKAS